MRFVISAAFIFLITGLLHAEQEATSKHYIQISTRTYFVEPYLSTEAPTGIMVLHGAMNEDGIKSLFRGEFRALMKRLSKKHSLVAVYPLGVRGRCPVPKDNFCWPLNSPGDDIDFLKGISSEVGSQYTVRRWIVIGISNGGFYLSSLIQSGKSLPFDDAVILLGGKAWWPETDIQWMPNLYILSGKKDEHRRHAIELYDDLRLAQYHKKTKLRYAELPGGHEIAWDMFEKGMQEILDQQLIETFWISDESEVVDFSECEKDNDCVSIKGDCCGCSSGGAATAVNKTHVPRWPKKLSEKCKETVCPAVISDHWTCFANPKCVKNKCELMK